MRAIGFLRWATAVVGAVLLVGCSNTGWNRFPGLGWMTPGRERPEGRGNIASSGEQDQPEVRQVSGPGRTAPDGSPPAPASSGGGPLPITRGAEHYVLPGQTLSEISRRSGISVEAIQAANGLTDDRIRAGQWLRIPAR